MINTYNTWLAWQHIAWPKIVAQLLSADLTVRRCIPNNAVYTNSLFRLVFKIHSLRPGTCKKQTNTKQVDFFMFGNQLFQASHALSGASKKKHSWALVRRIPMGFCSKVWWSRVILVVSKRLINHKLYTSRDIVGLRSNPAFLWRICQTPSSKHDQPHHRWILVQELDGSHLMRWQFGGDIRILNCHLTFGYWEKTCYKPDCQQSAWVTSHASHFSLVFQGLLVGRSAILKARLPNNWFFWTFFSTQKFFESPPRDQFGRASMDNVTGYGFSCTKSWPVWWEKDRVFTGIFYRFNYGTSVSKQAVFSCWRVESLLFGWTTFGCFSTSSDLRTKELHGCVAKTHCHRTSAPVMSRFLRGEPQIDTTELNVHGIEFWVNYVDVSYQPASHYIMYSEQICNN